KSPCIFGSSKPAQLYLYSNQISVKRFILCAIPLVTIGSIQFLPAQTGTDAGATLTGGAQPISKLYQELIGNNGKGQKAFYHI
ncbi:MAG TPA: hypothetical protein VL053_11770, partial [Arachidicoccus sp.]|nr:hypothetical protein [Arachidicoccus sp.]